MFHKSHIETCTFNTAEYEILNKLNQKEKFLINEIQINSLTAMYMFHETLLYHLNGDLNSILRDCIKPIMMRQDYGSSVGNFFDEVKSVIKNHCQLIKNHMEI